jgi:hypothetical protein
LLLKSSGISGIALGVLAIILKVLISADAELKLASAELKAGWR